MRMIQTLLTAIVVIALVACSKSDKAEPRGEAPIADRAEPAEPSYVDPAIAVPKPPAAKQAADDCVAVIEHLFAIEAKEMAPASFAQPDDRKRMMMASCKRAGLAPGEAACLLEAKASADFAKCRPADRVPPRARTTEAG